MEQPNQNQSNNETSQLLAGETAPPHQKNFGGNKTGNTVSFAANNNSNSMNINFGSTSANVGGSMFSSSNMSSQLSLFAKSNDDIMDPEATGFEAVGVHPKTNARPAFPPSASMFVQAEQRRQTKLEVLQMQQQLQLEEAAAAEGKPFNEADEESDMLSKVRKSALQKDVAAARLRGSGSDVGSDAPLPTKRRRQRQNQNNYGGNTRNTGRNPTNVNTYNTWQDDYDDSSILSRTQSQLMSVRTLKRVKDNAAPSSGVVTQSLEKLNDDNIERLEHGIPCKKVTSRGQLKPRTLTISQDHCALFVTHQPFAGGKKKKKQQQHDHKQTTRYASRYNSKNSNNGNGILSTMANKVTHAPLWSRAHGFRGYFLWRPSKHQVSVRDKYVRYIDVADLCGWHVGVVGSSRLELARKKNPSKRNPNNVDSHNNPNNIYSSRIDDQVERIVTILYKQQQTLDVLIARPQDRQALIDSLRQMRATYHATKVWVTNEALLLRYIWYDIDLDRDGGIGLREFKVLLQRINLQVPNVEKEFHNYLEEVSTVLDEPEREFFRMSLPFRASTLMGAHRRGSAVSRRRGSSNSQFRSNKRNKKVESLSYEEVLTLLQRIKNKIGSKTPVIGMVGMGPSTSARENSNANLDATFIPQQAMDNANETHGSIANQIWNEIFGTDRNIVSVNQFWQDFLLGQQKMMHVTMPHARELLSTLSKMESNHVTDQEKEKRRPLIPTASQEQQLLGLELTRVQFEIYLFDTLNSAYDPLALNGGMISTMTQDGDEGVEYTQPSQGQYPLSAYWINTSHNTYLTGDQLKSNSSVSMYMSALRRGCKCLELDCWDGERSPITGQPLPVIYHGHTLTSKILFVDVIRCIKSYLLSNPETYPIILSLENHCSLEYQETMASDMKDILGDALYVPENHIQQDHHQQALPSPEELIGKVVLKGKRPPEEDEEDAKKMSKMMTPINVETESSIAEEEQDLYDMAASMTTRSTATSPSTSINTSARKPQQLKILPELARLTLFHGTKYKSFSKSMLEPTSHMHSVGETKFAKIVNKKPENASLWRKYNSYHMTRTYPKGSRVDSSNYNPTTAWAVGCQLVALNFQTVDSSLVINDGRFRENQRRGYVLKPNSILPDTLGDDTTTEKMEEPSCSDHAMHEQSDELDQSLGSVLGGITEEKTAVTKETDTTTEEKAAVDESESEVELDEVKLLRRLALEPSQRQVDTTEDKEEQPAAVAAENDCSQPTEPISPENFMTNHVEPMTLRIRILAGSCLPKPLGEKTGETIDPYVTVTLHDVKMGNSGSTRRTIGKMVYVESSFETRAVDNNGYCPIFKEGRDFKKIEVLNPQVAMLQFTLNEKDVVGSDERVAEAAIPCSRLRQGYRSVQLFDLHNTRTGPFGFASLLVDIEIVR